MLRVRITFVVCSVSSKLHVMQNKLLGNFAEKVNTIFNVLLTMYELEMNNIRACKECHLVVQDKYM